MEASALEIAQKIWIPALIQWLIWYWVVLGNYVDDALFVILSYHTLWWGAWKIYELGGCAVVSASWMWFWGLGEVMPCICFVLYRNSF